MLFFDASRSLELSSLSITTSQTSASAIIRNRSIRFPGIPTRIYTDPKNVPGAEHPARPLRTSGENTSPGGVGTTLEIRTPYTVPMTVLG